MICDAYGNYLEYDGNPDILLDWLFKHSCDLNFFYNLQFDGNIIFQALLPGLNQESGETYTYKNYEITYHSGKSLTIKKIVSKTEKEIIRFFDIMNFYSDGETYGLDDTALSVLQIGKNSKELEIDRVLIGTQPGYYEANRQKIIEYCIQDAYITMLLAKRKILSLLPILDGNIPKVYSSSASISKAYMTLKHPELRYIYYKILSQLSDDWKKGLKIITNSYYGGIFYLHSLGKISNCYEYDLNSAYPDAMTRLYNLEGSKVRYTTEYEESDYSFYHVKIINKSNLPLHYRVGKSKVAYIQNREYVEGYFTGLELKYFKDYHSKDIKIEVKEGILINTTKKPEFPEFKELYNKRNEIKKRMKEKRDIENILKKSQNNAKDILHSKIEDMEQYGYKVILNASYGIFAETKYGFTSFTNHIYASYITAETRIKIYKMIDKVGWEHIKGIMTDAVITDIKIEDDNLIGNELGKFKMEFEKITIYFFMNGIYVIEKNGKYAVKNRGFQHVSAKEIFQASGDKLKLTRYNKITTIKEGYIQGRPEDIGKMGKQTKVIRLSANRDRYLLDVSKLTFDYLKRNELQTDYLDNDLLEDKYRYKPMIQKIDYKSVERMIRQSEKSSLTHVKEYKIKPKDYEAEIEKIMSGDHKKRNIKKFYNRYKRRLDSEFYAIDNFSQRHRITEDNMECLILKFNNILIDLSAL